MRRSWNSRKNCTRPDIVRVTLGTDQDNCVNFPISFPPKSGPDHSIPRCRSGPSRSPKTGDMMRSGLIYGFMLVTAATITVISVVGRTRIIMWVFEKVGWVTP